MPLERLTRKYPHIEELEKAEKNRPGKWPECEINLNRRLATEVTKSTKKEVIKKNHHKLVNYFGNVSF